MSRQSPWFKCFPTDWLEGTRNLTPEQRGVYFDCLCLIYEFERPLKDDDKWMSHQLHISPRLWRSIRDALVAAGKLVVVDGGLTNVRANFEIDSRLSQRRVKAESAVKRERTKRETSEKRNENNETEAQEHHYARLDEMQEARVQTVEVETPPTPSATGTAIATRSWDDDVAAHQHKTITIENGRPILHNGTHAYWLEMFGDDEKRLELALVDAMGSVQKNSRQDPAIQISRRLAQIAGQKHDQDQRYQSAVKSKPQYRPAAEDRLDRTRAFRSHLRTGRPS